jgi:hypothetical protein
MSAYTDFLSEQIARHAAEVMAYAAIRRADRTESRVAAMTAAWRRHEIAVDAEPLPDDTVESFARVAIRALDQRGELRWRPRHPNRQPRGGAKKVVLVLPRCCPARGFGHGPIRAAQKS